MLRITISSPRQRILDNHLTDEEQTCENRYVVLEKGVEITNIMNIIITR